MEFLLTILVIICGFLIYNLGKKSNKVDAERISELDRMADDIIIELEKLDQELQKMSDDLSPKEVEEYWNNYAKNKRKD